MIVGAMVRMTGICGHRASGLGSMADGNASISQGWSVVNSRTVLAFGFATAMGLPGVSHSTTSRPRKH